MKDAFKFGASRIFESTYAVIVNFVLGGYLVRIRVCVVNGDVPLLLSRGALGAMGMVLDVAENCADFRKVGVQSLQLEVTSTGHPALPVHPEPVPRGADSFSQGSRSELQLIKKESQYMVFAATCSASEAAAENEGRSTPCHDRLFYPKKIGSATHNMLLDDQFCMHSFIAWWEGTNISNDFWVEGDQVLVRVHVIPRKNFFDPRDWTTTQEMQKERLLGTLGEVRSTWGVSCKDYRLLRPQHELWRCEKFPSTFATLWIGKTVFARKPMLSPAPLSPFVSNDHGPEVRVADRAGEGEGTVGPLQVGAVGRGPSERTVGESGVVRAGDTLHHPRGHEHLDTCSGGFSTGDFEHVVGGSGLYGGGPRDQGSGWSHKGEHHEADQGRRRWGISASHDVRPLQVLPLQRNPGGIPEMGHRGGHGKREPQRGAPHVRELVQGEHGEQHQTGTLCGRGRPGAKGEDPVCARRVGHPAQLGAVGAGTLEMFPGTPS